MLTTTAYSEVTSCLTTRNWLTTSGEIINHHCSFLELDTGLPLGLGMSSYPQCTITLSAGTRLLLYTDGIAEAVNSKEEEYGPARLIKHFRFRSTLEQKYSYRNAKAPHSAGFFP